MIDPRVMLCLPDGWRMVTPEFAKNYLRDHPGTKHRDIQVEVDDYDIYADDLLVNSISFTKIRSKPDYQEHSAGYHIPDYGYDEEKRKAEVELEMRRARAAVSKLRADVERLNDWNKAAQRDLTDLKRTLIPVELRKPVDIEPPPVPSEVQAFLDKYLTAQKLSPVAKYVSTPPWEQPPAAAPAATSSPRYHYWRHVGIIASAVFLLLTLLSAFVTHQPLMLLGVGVLTGFWLAYTVGEHEHMKQVRADLNKDQR